MIGRWRRVQREALGLNRRNHSYLFAHNARDRYALVDDKRATKVVLARHGLPAPVLRATCETQAEVRRLGATLAEWSDFVLKPARGAGGAGIVVIVGRADDAFVKASGAHLQRRDLEAHVCDILSGTFSHRGATDVALVEDRILPEPTLARLAHRGVPDVRVLVFRGVPVQAMLRLPTRRSDGRANLHLGGVGVGLELATGRSTTGVCGRHLIDVHPDLGIPLAGFAVPAWPQVLALAARAADAVGLGFVGVDIVHDARHGPLVLELNARPGLAIQVANRRGLRPLLEAVAEASVPATTAARVALGQALARAATLRVPARGGS